MNWIPINWELARNPYNWVVLFLMVAIAALGAHIIFASPSTQDATP